MYPLIRSHPDSFGAAQAALAAQAQGKFHEMHDLIFEKFGAQKKADLRTYAQQLGLDLARNDADNAPAEAPGRADMKDGEVAGVDGTPYMYLKGRHFAGPSDPKYFAAAIDEELAVRR
jgi:protein-disulfide isomerase